MFPSWVKSKPFYLLLQGSITAASPWESLRNMLIASDNSVCGYSVCRCMVVCTLFVCVKVCILYVGVFVCTCNRLSGWSCFPPDGGDTERLRPHSAGQPIGCPEGHCSSHTCTWPATPAPPGGGVSEVIPNVSTQSTQIKPFFLYR